MKSICENSSSIEFQVFLGHVQQATEKRYFTWREREKKRKSAKLLQNAAGDKNSKLVTKTHAKCRLYFLNTMQHIRLYWEDRSDMWEKESLHCESFWKDFHFSISPVSYVNYAWSHERKFSFSWLILQLTLQVSTSDYYLRLFVQIYLLHCMSSNFSGTVHTLKIYLPFQITTISITTDVDRVFNRSTKYLRVSS